jgi:Spy/CpxP family protein refolding chaperone
MKNLVQKSVLFAIVLALALPAVAVEKGKKGGKKGAPDQETQLLQKIEKLNLDADKLAKIKELVAKCREKLAEPTKVLQPAMQQMTEARKKAEADGKKGKEVMQAVDAVLTPEQKKANAEIRELRTSLRKEISALLTAEQQKEVGIDAGKGGKKK